MTKQKAINKPGIPVPALWQRRYFLPLIVFLFSFLLFANSISNGYNLDDELVTINHRLTSQGIAAIPEIFTSPYYQDAQGYAYEYRPIVLVSFAIEHELFGDNPTVSHFINVLLYALCCVLLFMVLRRLLKRYSVVISFAIALLFAAHTAHTEVVCSIKNRDEILALIFGLLSMWTAIVSVNTGRKWLMIFAPVFFALGMISKLSILSFIVIIPLSLILFTEAGALTVCILNLAFLVPVFLLMGQNDTQTKLKIVVASALIVVGLLILKNANDIWTRAKALYNSKDEEEYSIADGGFNGFIKGITSDKTLLEPASILFSVIPGLTYLFLTSLSFSLAGLLPLCILIISIWKGNKTLSWWSATVLGICLISNCPYLLPQPGYYESYISILLKYFALYIVFGRRDLLLPNLLCFIALACFEQYQHPDISEVGKTLVTIPLISLLSFRRIRIALFVIIPLFLAFDLFDIRAMFTFRALLYELAIVWLLVTIIAIHYRKRVMEAILVFALLAGLFFHYVLIAIIINPTAAHTRTPVNTNTTVAFTEQSKALITPKIQDRPLDYIEQCITVNDPQDIRIGTSLEIMSRYLQKVILPYPLSFYYGYKYIQPRHIYDPIPLIGLILYLLILAAAIRSISIDPLISFGLFVLLFSILTFSDYLYAIPGMMGDRYLLLPSIGWCAIVVGLLRRVSGISDSIKDLKWPAIKPIAQYGFLFILILYSALTFSRNTNWKNALTLFRHDIKYVGLSAHAHNLLALRLMQTSQAEADTMVKIDMQKEALQHFKRAIEIYPAFYNAAYDLGRVYAAIGMPDSALATMKYVITIDSSDSGPYRAMGSISASKGAYAEAAIYFERCIALDTADYATYDKLGYLYLMLHEYERSITINKKILLAEPTQPRPYGNVARAFLMINQRDSAKHYLEQASHIAPGDADIQNLLQQVNNTGQ